MPKDKLLRIVDNNERYIEIDLRGGSYIDSPKWLKNKKTTINPKNNDESAFNSYNCVIKS